MKDFFNLNDKSVFLSLNLRDFFRGLIVALLAAILGIIGNVDHVVELASKQLWISALDGAWKALMGYLTLNLFSGAKNTK